MTNMEQLFKQVRKMQAEMEKIQTALESETVEGSAGGGMVKVTVNGKRDVLNVKIDPEVVKPDDVEMLEELICAAVNQAQQKAAELQAQSMSKLTGGLPLPGMGF
ncbi:MAG: YbaB/EbfC family nucleoid-associated protein [candidate division Zixibacteria bacterium]|nr:YbaB/EbfC family nucleoid-associated protein [candidate division Zixibacteria bacterium]